MTAPLCPRCGTRLPGADRDPEVEEYADDVCDRCGEATARAAPERTDLAEAARKKAEVDAVWPIKLDMTSAGVPLEAVAEATYSDTERRRDALRLAVEHHMGTVQVDLGDPIVAVLDTAARFDQWLKDGAA